MGKYIGIDLGTTFSCAAFIDENGQPQIIPNSEGENTTPSAVLFDGDTTIVGSEAKSQSIMDPNNYEQFVKRHMGQRDYHFTPDSGESYSPEAVSGIILTKIKNDAEDYLGDTVDGAVITVPAYFDEAKRKSTMDAGRIAGLNVLAIINEPTAAALAFGISKGTDQEQTIMVYDLGGGTFDVTVMKFDKDDIEVLGTAGDSMLGGYDFDQAIIDAVSQAAQREGLNIEADPVAKQDLQLKAETAKKSLSSKNKTNIMLNIGGKPFKYTLTKEDFEDLIEPLLFRTVSSVMEACDEAGLEYSDLDKILLVGGSTRVPLVKDTIKEETGLEPSSEVHADEAVAIGAAYHVLDKVKQFKDNPEAAPAAASPETTPPPFDIDIPETGKSYSFSDVTSHGIGIVAYDDNGEPFNTVVLPKNTKVPAQFSANFTTSVPFQETLNISVTQGEDNDVQYVTVIGETEIEIEPREQIVPIEITISCDDNSIIHVNVFDGDKNEDLGEMYIDRVANLTEEEVQQNQLKVSMLDISGE